MNFLKDSKTRDGLIKVIIQIIAFFFYAEAFVISLNAVKQLCGLAASKTITAETVIDPLAALMMTVLATIICGRYFCGYLCSFGAMQDLLFFISLKLIKKRIALPKEVERVLNRTRYFVLIAIVGMSLLGMPIDSENSPWVAFGNVLGIRDLEGLKVFTTIGGVLLIAIMIGSIFVDRFFCRFICPMGLIYSCISKYNRKKNKKSCAGCGDCAVCTNKCGNQKVSYRGLFITIALLFVFGIVWPKYSVNLYEVIFSEKLSSNKNEAGLADGVYEGHGQGYRGDIAVAVTVKDGNISDIVVDETADDDRYIERVTQKLIPKIIENQSTDVDAVSGATYSSRGLLDAVEDAVGAKEKTNSKSGQVGDSAESTANMAGENGELGELADGEYLGAGEGFRGQIKVRVTVENHQISNVEILSYYDTDEYLFHVAPSVISSIIENQNLNVDAVSGATYSRNGIVEAVANALGIEESEYDLIKLPVRQEKHKQQRHVVKKTIESENQYNELVEQYRDTEFDSNGIRVR